MAPRIDRRGFLIGGVAAVAAAVAGACGRGAAADQPVRRVPPAPTLDVYDGGEPLYVEDARAWVVPVPEEVRPRAEAMLPDDMRTSLAAGFIALSDVCPADKLQLRFCKSAGWFECPGCGSRFDGLGDQTGGPAPAGLTMLTVEVDDAGDVAIKPRPRVPGLPSGEFLVVHRATGPHCS